MNRRGLLLGLGALFAAPAIVRVASLMPVSVLQPELLISGLEISDPDTFGIMVGNQRMVWDGKLWVTEWTDPVIKHWSEASPQPVRFNGYVARTNGGVVPDVAQDAIQKALDGASYAAYQERLARYLKSS